MLIKNLLIKFVRRQGEKSVFQTEAGAEIIFDSYLLEDKLDENQDYYLSLDSSAIKLMEESQKKILNELIGNDVEGQN
ncbi:MAG: hypothetical protein QG642_678 [Patescibacteria group bacterium]|nr:hypothetical protein [Patescibacteria group bacterium]